MNNPQPKAICLSFLLAVVPLLAQHPPGAVVVSAPQFDASGSTHTLPLRIVAIVGNLPSTGCKPGEMAVVIASYPNWNYANNGNGACNWTNQTGGSGGPFVSSVGLSLPGSLFAVSGSPVTSTGTLTGTFQTQAAHAFFGGPTSGSPATPTVRTFVASDIAPAGTLTNSTSGNAATATGAAGTPTLCSAGSYARGIDGTFAAAGCTVIGGGTTGLPYVTNATTSTQTITAATHLQGINGVTTCYTGAVVAGSATGTATPCVAVKDPSGNGDLAISWAGTTVGSIEIAASGPGPSSGSGTVTTVSTTGPISGGPFTVTGTISCPTCTTSASALTSGSILFGAGSQAMAVGNLSGDATTTGAVVTLSTVNGAPGSCGDATHVCAVVTNGKGLVTSQTAVVITGSGGGVTSVGSNAPLTGGPITGAGTLSCPTCVTSASSLSNGALVIGTGGGQGTATSNLNGDVSTSGTTTTTLATVNVGPGACGDATHVCQVTTNGKGLVTGQSAVAITAGGTGTVTNVATTGPLVGGPITSTGTLSCPTCAVIGSPVNGTVMISLSGTTIGPATGVISGTSGDLTVSGFLYGLKGLAMPQGADPGVFGSNSFQLIGNTSIPSSYRWMVPSADSAGAILSDGAGTPGHLSIVATTGSGNIMRSSAVITSLTTTSPIAGGPITGAGTVSCPTCVASSAALTNNQLIFGAGSQNAAVGDLTGDITTAGGKATTLATVNANVGVCGDATHVSQITLDAKGRATACAPVLITGGGGGGGTVTAIATAGPLTGGTITTTGTIACATCVTSASPLGNGQIVTGSGGGQGTASGNLSGDITTSGSLVATLATVNGGSGICGDSTHYCVPTTNPKGLVTSQTTFAFPNTSTSTDIRLYGAVCNGTNQNTAVVAALTAGKTNLFFPTGCNWTLPSGAWTYGSVAVAPNSVPAGLTLYGEDWVNSVIQTSSPSSVDMQMGGGTTIYNMNLPSHACAPWDQNSQSFISGIACPNQIYTNGGQIFSGTVTASGTAVTWSSGTKFNCRTSEGSSWVGRTISLNSVIYTVTAVGGCSGTITTTLTVNTTVSGCGAGCNYSFANNYPFISTGYQPYTYVTGGPGDFAGIQATSHGAGDAIFASTTSTNGTGVRVGMQQNGHIGVLVQKFNAGIAFSIIDDTLFGAVPSGTGYDYFTQSKQTGPFFSATQQASTYSGDAFTLDLASGSGACTGRFIKFTKSLSAQFTVDCSGNTSLGQLTINDSSNIFLFGAIPSSGSGSGGYLCRDSVTGKIYQKSSCP